MQQDLNIMYTRTLQILFLAPYTLQQPWGQLRIYPFDESKNTHTIFQFDESKKHTH